MGTIDEEDRPFMIVDNDTGKIFDTRIDKHVEKVTNDARRTTIHTKSSGPSLSQSSDDKANKKDLRKSMAKSAWGDWWDEKK